jgi:CRP/FNR family transcriptional regulator, anaerobic regulatory protein
LTNISNRKPLAKKGSLLTDGKICSFIAFISVGAIRHFHLKNGIAKTCDISFENKWVTDFQSFTYDSPSIMNLHALFHAVNTRAELMPLSRLTGLQHCR